VYNFFENKYADYVDLGVFPKASVHVRKLILDHLIETCRAKYDSSKRSYHDWQHIVECFDVLEDCELVLLRDDDICKSEILIAALALLWHDYTYELGSYHSEKLSADNFRNYFVEHFDLTYENEVLEKVYQEIVKTKYDFSNLKLKTLTQCVDFMRMTEVSKSAAIKYTNQVYHEFSQVVDRLEFLKGRLDWLNSMKGAEPFEHWYFKEYNESFKQRVTIEIEATEELIEKETIIKIDANFTKALQDKVSKGEVFILSGEHTFKVTKAYLSNGLLIIKD